MIGYNPRQNDSKRKAVRAFHDLNYKVIAVGDSHNDTTMFSEADVCILFRPPRKVIAEFPLFTVASDYEELCKEFSDSSNRLEKKAEKILT